MKEYDIDSYSRKWRQTFGVYSTAKNELQQGYFQDFFEIDRNIIGVEIETPLGHEKRCVLERSYADYDMVKIEYHPIESGWYPSMFGFALLVRKHIRGFQQGLSAGNHDLTAYTPSGAVGTARFHHCDFLKRPDYSKMDPEKPFGIMSDRIWWRNGLIHFLNRTIGTYVGNRVMLESKAFTPYIRPLLEDKCQIV